MNKFFISFYRKEKRNSKNVKELAQRHITNYKGPDCKSNSGNNSTIKWHQYLILGTHNETVENIHKARQVNDKMQMQIKCS